MRRIRTAFKPVVLAASLCGTALPAWADDAVPAKLPTLALNPQPESASPWSGFYVGSEVIAIARKGGRGGFGGAAYAGYNREFDNNMVIGIQASTGVSPGAFRWGPVSSYNFATTDVKLGYDMGRLMPFVTAGVAFAHPNFRGATYTGLDDSINGLFSSSDVRVYGHVGAGFNYAITDRLSVGVSVSAGNGPGFVAP